MALKITTLCENTAVGRDILGEHGLAVLVEAGNRRFLFDTGAGMTLLHNAAKMRVDLDGLDGVILSHGHYDHTGGLKPLLQAVGPTTVYAHPDVFGEKYRLRRDGGEPVYVGMPCSRKELEDAGANFVLTAEPCRIADGLLITGEIPREDPREGFEESFFVKSGDGLVHDEVRDDLALIVETEAGAVLVLGCAHSGPVNSLKHALKILNGRRVRGVVGGMHLKDADSARIGRTVAAYRELGVETVAPCHCTGLAAMAAFLRRFGRGFRLNNVGSAFTAKDLFDMTV